MFTYNMVTIPSAVRVKQTISFLHGRKVLTVIQNTHYNSVKDFESNDRHF